MDSAVKRRSFTNTIAALAAFDASAAEREEAWNKAETNEAIDAADLADLVALRKVQRAFHQDTSDINSQESCYRIDLAFMRRAAAQTDRVPA